MDDPARPIEPEELLAEAGWLRALARRLTADAEEARELEQETWRAALARPPRARGDRGSVRPWLQAVASNLWRRRRRDAAARAYHEADAAARAYHERAAAGGEAVEERTTLARLELQAQVVAAVRALREPYRTAVTLRWLDGLGYDEVARRTGASEEAARKRVSRGLDELRRRLDRAYGGRSAWSALAFALGRELPVPPAAAVPPGGAVQPAASASGGAAPGASTAAGAAAAGLRTISGAGSSGTAAAGSAAAIAGGMTMTVGAKLGAMAAAGVLVAGGLWWVGREGAADAEPARGTSAAPDAGLLAAPPAAEIAGGGGAPAREAERAEVAVPPAPDLPPPTSAEELRIVARVVDAAGAPVADAPVELLRFHGDDFETLDLAFAREESRVGVDRTDPDGAVAFAVEAGRRYVLRASAPAARPDLATADATAVAGDELALALARAAVVSGQVVRPDELPAIGAEVRLRPQGGSLARRFRARTDASGAFRFAGLAPGAYFLEVSSSEGATPPTRDLVVHAGREETLVLRLERGFPITGRVTDAVTGAPVAGARVSESWVFETWVTTDADGRYAYEYPREGYVELEFDATGYGRRSVQVRSYFGAGMLGERFDVELVPGATVAGRVVDRAGTPLAGVYVACAASAMQGEAQQTTWRAARTDAEGSFTVVDAASHLENALFIAHEGYGTRVLDLGRPQGRVELGDVVLAQGATVAGRVVDAAGEPLAGAKVVLHGASADRRAWLDAPQEVTGVREAGDLDGYVAEREARTDARGRYAFLDVDPGAYRVEGFLRGLPEGISADVAVAEADRGGAVEAAELVLAAGLAIEGRVIGPDGAGVGRVFVNARSLAGGKRANVMSEPDGAFRVIGLEPGIYGVELLPVFEAGTTKLARARLGNVPAGSGGYVVQLAEAVALVGRVVDASGAPVAGATVKMTAPDGVPGGWTETDRDGRFDFEPPAGVLVELSAHPPLADQDGSRPFQHDDDPARAARLSGVDAAAGEVVLELP